MLSAKGPETLIHSIEESLRIIESRGYRYCSSDSEESEFSYEEQVITENATAVQSLTIFR